jgi:hypothetical protein
VSSESASAYESLSSASDLYNTFSTQSAYSFPLDIDMEFSRVRLNAPASDYGPITAAHVGMTAMDSVSDRSSYDSPGSSGNVVDDTSFGSLPSSPHLNNHGGSVYSEYAHDFYTPPASHHPSLYASNNTVSPATISQSNGGLHQAREAVTGGANLQLPYLSRMHRNTDSRHSYSQSAMPTSNTPSLREESPDDPRKKYSCNQCSRAFARAYNLKTHMATHDPNRLKPHVCPHRSCQRSFSRKHDLGRHLISIHRDDPIPSPADAKVGIAGKEGRKWCDDCGTSYTGKKACAHIDVK